MTEDFKKELTKSMNRGGWGKENLEEVIPLIDKYISEQLTIPVVVRQSGQLKPLDEDFKEVLNDLIKDPKYRKPKKDRF